MTPEEIDLIVRALRFTAGEWDLEPMRELADRLAAPRPSSAAEAWQDLEREARTCPILYALVTQVDAGADRASATVGTLIHLSRARRALLAEKGAAWAREPTRLIIPP